MFSTDNINSLAKEILARLNLKDSFNIQQEPSCSSNGNNQDNKNTNSQCKKVCISPSQALVISGLLGGVLEITSVLVDKDQTVEIILSGSLKQKTQLEKMLDQIGSMPFDEVVKTMLGRLQ